MGTSLEEYTFRDPRSKQIFEFLKEAYIKDDEVLRVPLDKCGWRSIVQIAEGIGLPPKLLYGSKPGKIANELQDLLKDHIIGVRYFTGERGRGGEVMRFRISDKNLSQSSRGQWNDLSPTPLNGNQKNLNELERRRLAAIMFADIVGYTALGQRDESLSLAVVNEQRKLIRPILRRHNGREVKTIGDGLLVEFPSALDGVRCAYDIQRATREFNFSLSEDRRLHLRIGVHLGDVVESGSDILGDAVNVASRIESLAEDGGVCVTRQVYDHVQNKLDLPLTRLGPKSLSGVDFPIEIFKMKMPWHNEMQVQPVKLDSRRIIVLPFANISPSLEDEYLADGITDELISVISKIREMRVIARTTAMKYKGSGKGIAEIGRELNVGTLLEGTVRKAESKLRITAQLIDSQSEEHLWSESYDREMQDIFAIQTEISHKIAEALRIQLYGGEKKDIERGAPANADVYTLYLKGRYYWNERNREAVDKAVKYFERAAKLDPGYALAFAGLADCYIIYGDYLWMKPNEAFPKAREYAMKAIELDPRLAEPHVSLGAVYNSYEGLWPKSVEEFKKAIDLKPSYVWAHLWYALQLFAELKFEEAYRRMEKALELDPLSRVIRLDLGGALIFKSRAEDAIKKLKELIYDEPGYWAAHFGLSQALFLDSKTEEAIDEGKKALALSGGDPSAKAELACLLGCAGERDEADQLLQELLDQSQTIYISAMDIAKVLFAVGRNDDGFGYLDKAIQERSVFINHSGVLADIRALPWFGEVRKDPRWEAFLQRIGIASSISTVPFPDASYKIEQEKRRLAVLPLVNMTSDREDEFFSDGVTEEIISAISQFQQLRVISRTSIMRFKNTTKSLSEIGRELGVGSVLEGSVRKHGNKIRVSLKLIEVETDEHKWSQNYDRDLTDVFAIQSDIATNVAESLRIRLVEEERERIKKVPTKNSEAHRLYLKGRYFWNERTRESVGKAVKYFEAATKLDPMYAPAYAGLADCYVVSGDYMWMQPKEAMPKAKEYALKAINLDPQLSEAHALIGLFHASYEWRWDEAEKEFIKAIEFKPSYATAYHWYSHLLRATGRSNEAYEQIKRASELDPMSRVIAVNLGESLLLIGKLAEGIEQMKKVKEDYPDYSWVRAFLGFAYYLDSKIEEGFKELRSAIEISGGDPLYKVLLAYLLGLADRRDEATEIIKELKTISKSVHIDNGYLGVALYAAGNLDEAFEYLEKAYEERSNSFLYIITFPWYSEFRKDPRWRSFEERLGIRKN